jgi:hypothetical protein
MGDGPHVRRLMARMGVEARPQDREQGAQRPEAQGSAETEAPPEGGRPVAAADPRRRRRRKDPREQAWRKPGDDEASRGARGSAAPSACGPCVARRARDAGIRAPTSPRGLPEALTARLTDALLGELVVRHPDRIALFLRDKVLLSCGRPECPTIPGLAVLVVPAERCDACGGADVDRARRRFQDACLVHGILVVGVVGGSVRDQRLLERASTHHRLALRVFGSPVDARAAGAQLVIAWNARREGPRAIATHARNAVALMDDVAESLLS